MADLPAATPEQRAYREAGHAVMSYLIRGGFTDQHIPIDRSLILPPFKRVAIEGTSGDWGEITPGLGSLITAPQVLIAGVAVDQIQGRPVNLEMLRSSPQVEKAFDLLGSYIEEYGEENGRERDRQAWEWLGEMYVYVVEMLQIYWSCVEALAKALLEYKGLSEARAFEVIEKAIHPEVRNQAAARVEKSKAELTQNAVALLFQANADAVMQAVKRVEAKTAKKKWWWPF
jgi:hypothetical protein